MREKSKYSFLIAFAKQLAKALEDDSGDDDVAIAVASIATSLDVLLADGLAEAGEDADGADDGVDEFDDGEWDATEVGRRAAATLAARHAPPMVRAAERRLVGGGGAEHLVRGAPAGAPVRMKKGSKRRGKK